MNFVDNCWFISGKYIYVDVLARYYDIDYCKIMHIFLGPLVFMAILNHEDSLTYQHLPYNSISTSLQYYIPIYTVIVLLESVSIELSLVDTVSPTCWK